MVSFIHSVKKEYQFCNVACIIPAHRDSKMKNIQSYLEIDILVPPFTTWLILGKLLNLFALVFVFVFLQKEDNNVHCTAWYKCKIELCM